MNHIDNTVLLLIVYAIVKVRAKARAMSENRSYNSPLRDEQAQGTRDRILDAFTDLLAGKRADDITTRQIAQRAGVSQPTVYRHFPDRTALLEGVAARVRRLFGEDRTPGASLDDRVEGVAGFFAEADRHSESMRAEVLLNSDPRSFATSTSATTREVLDAVGHEYSEFDERQRTAVAGLLRCLVSSHSWLRMREEFGVPGSESGPLFQWAVTTLIGELRQSGYPGTTEKEET